MIYKRVIFFFCIFSIIPFSAFAQGVANTDFKNESLLAPVFEKLYQLDKSKASKKVNIVHVGDSHVQADIFTNVIRQLLQAKFGNGGYGFTFPYSLAKTNGTNYVKYTSDAVWSSRRNIYPVTDVLVGLSGIGLYTESTNFEININVNPLYTFNKVKLLYPTQESLFKVNVSNADYYNIKASEVNVASAPITTISPVEPPKTDSNKTFNVVHKVESRETLYRIALNYGISVKDLKDANNLDSNSIRVGMDLNIPTKGQLKAQVVVPQVAKEKPKQDPQKNIPILSKDKMYESEFVLPTSSNELVILPNKRTSQYDLSGVVLENDKSGVIYHTIGVNGAKVSDYNKYPMFFDQLPSLSADLLVVSLGTNEAFGKWTTPYYISQIQIFIDKVRKNNPNMIILLMTPPPSLFRKSQPNTFVEGYSEALKELKGCVVWDLLNKLGGANAPLDDKFSPFMAKDKVHYTREGYQRQGELFATDFLTAYDKFVKSRTN